MYNFLLINKSFSRIRDNFFFFLLFREFRENFDTSESDENRYIEVVVQAEHESGLNFLLTLISNSISPLLYLIRIM